ncbi:hypothetical protein ACERIM_16890, partial [Natrinema sp. H-ect1]
MPITTESRKTVFRQIVRQSYVEWPAYDSTPLYDRTSLAGLESDVRIVSGVWFTHRDILARPKGRGFLQEKPRRRR